MISLMLRAGLMVFGAAVAACETVESTALEKSALDVELKNETSSGVTLPLGCPTLTVTLPAGRTSVTVSYEEPKTNVKGVPLADLAYTTVYVSAPKASTRAIRVWTNDPHGGAPVTIKDIPASGQEVGVCVTATNWARQESGPATPPAVTQTGKK